MKNNLKLSDGFVILSVITVLLFYSAPALCCYHCYPPCGACQTCQGGVCVNQCQPSQCQTCVNGQCQSLCNICQTCVNGQCQPKCNPVTQICENGQCIDKLCITYTYDEVGNRLTMVDSKGTTNYAYDYLSRLTSVTNPDNKTISYQYNGNGNRTQMTDPASNITTYTYDGDNRLTEENAPAGLTTYQYDSLGRQTRVDYPNGTYTLYTYNSQRNWLTSLVNKNSSDTVLSSFSYTYDNVGNRLSVTENDGSIVTYGYDVLYQLTSETRTGTNAYTSAYQYDSVGNRTQMIKNSVTTTYIYNNNNQLQSETAGGVTRTYSYDLNGNLISKNTTTYTWDWRNRLLSVSQPDITTTLYEYDGDGTRISKTTDGVKTKYINDNVFDLTQVLMETNNAGAVQATYTYGNDLISRSVASGQWAGVSYYHYDGLGSTRKLTNSSQTVIASYTYDGFGNFYFSGSSNNTYGFTGEQQFGEADNLVFLRARYYKPSIGRFISRDPILTPIQIGGYVGWLIPYLDLLYQPQSMNPYVYAQNNPVNVVDPLGTHPANRPCHYACAILSGIGAAACSLIPNPCAKAACLVAVGIGFMECNWRCDNPPEMHPSPPPYEGPPGFDPVEPPMSSSSMAYI